MVHYINGYSMLQQLFREGPTTKLRGFVAGFEITCLEL